MRPILIFNVLMCFCFSSGIYHDYDFRDKRFNRKYPKYQWKVRKRNVDDHEYEGKDEHNHRKRQEIHRNYLSLHSLQNDLESIHHSDNVGAPSVSLSTTQHPDQQFNPLGIQSHNGKAILIGHGDGVGVPPVSLSMTHHSDDHFNPFNPMESHNGQGIGYGDGGYGAGCCGNAREHYDVNYNGYITGYNGYGSSHVDQGPANGFGHNEPCHSESCHSEPCHSEPCSGFGNGGSFVGPSEHVGQLGHPLTKVPYRYTGLDHCHINVIALDPPCGHSSQNCGWPAWLPQPFPLDYEERIHQKELEEQRKKENEKDKSNKDNGSKEKEKDKKKTSDKEKVKKT